MNNKENLVVGDSEGGLSAEQKARISQNFRAAKALLARKRPRETCKLSAQSPHIDRNTGGDASPFQVADIKRLPLTEIPMDTPSFERFNLTNCDSLTNSCPKVLDTGKIDVYTTTGAENITPIKQPEPCFDILDTPNGDLRVRGRGVPQKGGVGFSFVTPMRQSNCSSLSESISSYSVLVDDFDDSILEEIDALCENSTSKSEREVSNSTLVDSQHVNNSIRENNTCINLHLSHEKLSNENASNPCSDQFGSEVLQNFETQVKNMPEEYAKYMKSLNDRQREAACGDISTPLMIVAGPGSGKTSTMVGRVLMLLNEGIGPSHILAMTFTTAAATEMRERIASVAGKAAAKEITISTFHSFSLQLCRLHAEKLSRTPEFLIYGHGQQRRAIIEAVRLLDDGNKMSNHEPQKVDEMSGVSSPQYFKDKSKKWLKYVSKAKAAGRTPEDCRRLGDEIGAEILQNYDDILKSCNALDYHDLISCSVKLLNEFPAAFKECQDLWKAIVIDEFQDTSTMQYGLLRILASHKRITIVGDEDQSIFSFNGADVSGFASFRKDFPMHKEVRLNKNYRSTRCIVEAASSLIQNNLKRCQVKDIHTDNSSGSKITVKECSNDSSQCAFVVDKILEITSEGSATKCNFGNIAVLYRRQVSGKIFQTTFRSRKIPFNIHGVAFYRKKVVRAIIAMLRTALPACDDGPYRKVFKALLPFEKEEKKKVIEHIDKVSTVRKCSFIYAAGDIFSAKISGTFKRTQLTQGRKVLLTLDMISKLVHTEQSISAVITSVANMIPQRYLLEQRAIVDVDGGKLLNEDNDLRSVLQYLLDDVSDFFTTQNSIVEEKRDYSTEGKGCARLLKAFMDYVSERERDNFRSRRHDNKDSVTLTTIHQSKGLEWDVVFIIKVLQASRFLREIPHHLQEIQDEPNLQGLQGNHQQLSQETLRITTSVHTETELAEGNSKTSDCLNQTRDDMSKELTEYIEGYNVNSFLRRFHVEDRGSVSHLFHQWAKKPAFQDPKRLLNKVAFVIDERLRVKKSNRKDVLRTLKSCLHCDEAFQYAISVLKWEQIPADKRAQLAREKQEHFQKQRIESAMNSSTATSKQIAYLQNLGCTVTPTSRLHASRLIEQYKSL